MEMISSNIDNLMHTNAIFIIDEKSNIVYNNQVAESLLVTDADFKADLSAFLKKVNEEIIALNKSGYSYLPKTYNYTYNGANFKITADKLKFFSKKLIIFTFTEIDKAFILGEHNQLHKLKTDFISNISHEFRTPLNAILGYTELLMNDIQDEHQLNRLKIIKDNSKNLLTLINDLIVLSKIQFDILSIEHDDCDLTGLIDELFNIFRFQLNNKGLKFDTNYNQLLNIKLRIDEVLLRQILFNLIGNAIKFTNDGSVTVRIDYYNISEAELDLSISIIDTGIGIDENYKSRLFDLFSQANESNSKTFGGAGLGLAVVSRLVHSLGGEINCTSKLNEGTTFTLRFNQINYYNKTDRNLHTENIKLETFLKKIKKILIVDDSGKGRTELANLIGNSTVFNYQADNAESALIMAVEIKPDVIIMDLRMSGMSGIEAASHLKLNKTTRSIPIIGLSTLHHNIKSINENSLFYKVLEKPVLWDELLDVLINIDAQLNNF